MRLDSRFLCLPLVAAAVACSAGTEHTGGGQQADRYNGNEDPGILIPGASTLLSANIGAGDVGQTFGVDDAHIPYPDTYWPFVSGGIDNQWNAPNVSALDKYTSAFDAADAAAAKTWEANNHGPNVPNVAGWWGHCPGWTGAAMSVTPIQHDVWASSDGNGGVKACNQGDPGCVDFQIGDIDALLAESFVDSAGSFIGARCDTAPSAIQRDQYGRIVRDGTGCKGLNAGALVIALAQRMKVERQPMAIDAQNDFNTDQIWNQPAYRYTVYEYDDSLTGAQAANLVATGSRDGSLTSYPWDDAARGFVFVDIGIQWVSEYGPNLSFVSGSVSTNETRFAAVLELDSTPQDANANIIGGEFIDDPSVGADRLTVPPFVWTATGPGPDGLDPSVNGNDHNPYVQPSLVLQLAALGAQ